MRRCAAVLFVLSAVSLLSSPVVHADGFMVPDEATWKRMQERAYINEPEQKAAIFFDKGIEDLIISPSFEGPASRFAWVVPVPSRPKVDVLQGALFHELKAIVAPSQPKGRDSMSGRTYKAPAVELLERKTVGAYDVSVLKATDGQALFKWLKTNGYHVPPAAVGPIKAYVKDKWTFVACRVKVPQSAQGLRSGTLAPLRLTFPADVPVYPLRLSAANPEDFDVLIHLIVPTRSVYGQTNRILAATRPGDYPDLYGGETVKPTARANGVGKLKYPTLAKLTREEVRVFSRSFHLRPEECTQDCAWVIPPPQ